MNDADKADEPGGPAPVVTVPAGQQDAYRQLAASAAILGKGLEDLAQEAMMLGAPDPAALGAEGADWPNIENAGTVLRAWAVLVLGNVPKQPASGLIVVERKLDHP